MNSTPAFGNRQNAKEKFATMESDRIQVKGKTKPETVFTVLGRSELSQDPNFQELRDLTARILGYYRGKIGRRRWQQSNCAARLPNAGASARCTTCMPNASRLSALIRHPRIGTASTRPRANSL